MILLSLAYPNVTDYCVAVFNDGLVTLLIQVQDVYEFVCSLPGCAIYADEFRRQEIDGQALLLLTEDHMMTTFSMKLGPALKICQRIRALRDA
jgi:SAM domain (Sterile alpha motif)